jgi:hypothetical protein
MLDQRNCYLKFLEESDEEEEPEQEENAEGSGDEEDDAEVQLLVDEQKMLREELKDLQEKITEKEQQKGKAVNAIIQVTIYD